MRPLSEDTATKLTFGWDVPRQILSLPRDSTWPLLFRPVSSPNKKKKKAGQVESVTTKRRGSNRLGPTLCKSLIVLGKPRPACSIFKRCQPLPQLAGEGEFCSYYKKKSSTLLCPYDLLRRVERQNKNKAFSVRIKKSHHIERWWRAHRVHREKYTHRDAERA